MKCFYCNFIVEINVYPKYEIEGKTCCEKCFELLKENVKNWVKHLNDYSFEYKQENYMVTYTKENSPYRFTDCDKTVDFMDV